MAKRKKTKKKTTAKKKTSKTKTTKRKTSKRKSPQKSAQNEPLIVTSKVKSFIKSQDMMSGPEAIDALNQKVYDIVQEAIERAQYNKRSTLRPKDF